MPRGNKCSSPSLLTSGCQGCQQWGLLQTFPPGRAGKVPFQIGQNGLSRFWQHFVPSEGSYDQFVREKSSQGAAEARTPHKDRGKIHISLKLNPQI